MEAGPQVGWSWVLNTFPSRIYNLVCRSMHVSDWPKRPNMVPRPNLGGDSFFSATVHLAEVYSLAPTLLLGTSKNIVISIRNLATSPTIAFALSMR